MASLKTIRWALNDATNTLQSDNTKRTITILINVLQQLVDHLEEQERQVQQLQSSQD
jgi:hypothetical protein